MSLVEHQPGACGAGLQILMTVAVAMALSAAIVTPTRADPAAHPGHALAQRFAEDAQRARAAEAAKKASDLHRRQQAQKKWEADMLARAKAEAEERRRLEAEAARLDAARMAREAQEAETARRKAETVRAAEEKQLESRRIEAARLAEESRRAEAERIEAKRQAEATARIAEDARRAERAAWAEEEAKRTEEAQLAVKRATEEEALRVGALEADAEIERVGARLRAIREEHLARHMREGNDAPPAGEHVPSGGVGRLGVPSAPDMPRSTELPEVHKAADAPPSRYDAPSYDERSSYDAPSRAFSGRVTVLLQMEPSGLRGRRHESMDPVLCLVDGCYVSNGPEYPATFLHGRKATRFGNAISRRAGACNHAYTCVFRNVELGALPAEIQPVDIRVLRHDRRAPESVEALSTCRGTTGRLACTGAIRGDGYTMWVIPEHVAARLPIELFGVTTESGDRYDPRSAMAPPRGRW